MTQAGQRKNPALQVRIKQAAHFWNEKRDIHLRIVVQWVRLVAETKILYFSALQFKTGVKTVFFSLV